MLSIITQLHPVAQVAAVIVMGLMIVAFMAFIFFMLRA